MGTAPRLPELRECLDNAPREAEGGIFWNNDSSGSLPTGDILLLPYLVPALMESRLKCAAGGDRAERPRRSRRDGAFCRWFPCSMLPGVYS